MGLSYISVRFIRVENTKLALLHYALMIILLIYVIVFQIVGSKAYQEYDSLVGDVTFKIKGAVEDTDSFIYDSHDLIIPPMEQSALFVTTKFIQTNQTRGYCPGTKKCTNTSDCQTGDYGNYTENGRLTNTCDNNTCEIEGWCPVENDQTDVKIITSSLGDWTVFLKANVHFPKFKVRRSNAMSGIEPGINLFSIDEILHNAETTYNDVFSDGTIIVCEIGYDCDLNLGVDKCLPTFTWDRIDVRGFSTGFNYRYTETTGPNARLLTKVYGIRLVYSLRGEAGRFSIAQLTIALGAGLALLGISNTVCDFILEYLMPQKEYYASEKYTPVGGDQGSSSPPLLTPNRNQGDRVSVR